MRFYRLRLKLLQVVGLLYHSRHTNINKYYDVVIIRVDAIGDYIIWHDALVEYKKKFVGKKVLLICADIVRPLAEEEPFFSDILDFNRNKMLENIKYIYAILSKISSISTTTVLYPLWARHPVGDLIVKEIQSPVKIGMVGNCSHDMFWKIYNRYYTELIENPNSGSEILAVEHYTRRIIADNYKYGKNKLPSKDIDFGIKGKYVIIAVSASDDYKMWEIDKFAQVINMIPDKYSIVLSGAGINDEKRSKEIISLVQNKKRIVNKVNKTSLMELVSLIAHSTFLIGNDSSAVHIAAATHTPSICAFHGAHFGRFLPYPSTSFCHDYAPIAVYSSMDCFGCGYKCKYPKNECYECLRRVSVEMVKTELDKFLKRTENIAS